MIFKKLSGLLKYPEFTFSDGSMRLHNEEFTIGCKLDFFKSIIGKPSRIQYPNNPSFDYPIVSVYDHYGIVINTNKNSSLLSGIDFYYIGFPGLNLLPKDGFKGKITLFGFNIPPLANTKYFKEKFADMIIEEFVTGLFIESREFNIRCGFDERDVISSLQIKIK